jgi:hypothetical protein
MRRKELQKLRECPFCGDEYVQAEIYTPLSVFRIYCTGGDGCAASMELSFEDAGIIGGRLDFEKAQAIMEQLVEAWNRRAEDGTKNH